MTRRSGNEYKRQLAAEAIQGHARQRWGRSERNPPSLAIARAYADSFMPHSERGTLYAALDMTAPCRGKVPTAPASMEVFDEMGVNIGLYMRLVAWGMRLFAVLTVISFVPLVHNLLGSEQWHLTQQYNLTANLILTSHTLGNNPELNPLQGICDAVIVLVLLAALVRKQAQLRQHAESLGCRRPDQLNASNYTLLLRGFPRIMLPVAELRTLFESWGEVITVCITRADRELILKLRERELLASLDSARARKLSTQLDALRARPSPCTGILLVTFNEQRAAHACLNDLHVHPTRLVAGGWVNIAAEFAPHPDNILWENLEIGLLSRHLRGLLMNAIILCIACVSTTCIVAVTQRDSNSQSPDTTRP